MLTAPQLKPQGARSSGRCGGMLPEALGAAGSSPPSVQTRRSAQQCLDGAHATEEMWRTGE